MFDATKTSLTDIRDFLREENRSVAPWADSERVVDSLFLLVEEKKNDEAFWTRLRDLSNRLEDSRFSHSALSGSSLFPKMGVAQLLDQLKQSLGEPVEERRSLKTWVTGTVNAAALAGFLFLGMATGCSEESEYDGLCEEAKDEQIGGEDGRIYCDLIDVVKESSLDDWDKDVLLDCLPELDAAYREELLASFQDKSDAEIADALDRLTRFGMPCGEEDAH